MGFTFGYDVTGANYASAPHGVQLAGYDTGSGGVAWGPAMWATHPGAVHIDQAPDTALLRTAEPDRAGHVTCDVLDVERGAVPVKSPLIPSWARGAKASFAAASRPGQRRPLLYQSASNVTANVNALVAGGVTDGVGLWIASWGMPTAQAVAELAAAAGPFPVAGFQIANAGNYDVNVFSTAWLNDVSGHPSANWTFGPLTGFELTGTGPHSVAVRFSAPSSFDGTPPSPAPGITQYQVAVCAGKKLGACIVGYPRYLAKGPNPEQWQEGGLSPGTTYTGAWRVFDPAHAGPWSTATFTTPAS